jgi:ABC-2 type transport system permease protein
MDYAAFAGSEDPDEMEIAADIQAEIQTAAQAVGLLMWFVFLFLSGSGPPPEVLPDGLRTIGEWLPLTPIVQLMQEPWLTGEWLVRQSVVTIGIGAGSAVVAWFAYRWE